MLINKNKINSLLNFNGLLIIVHWKMCLQKLLKSIKVGKYQQIIENKVKKFKNKIDIIYKLKLYLFFIYRIF